MIVDKQLSMWSEPSNHVNLHFNYNLNHAFMDTLNSIVSKIHTTHKQHKWWLFRSLSKSWCNSIEPNTIAPSVTVLVVSIIVVC